MSKSTSSENDEQSPKRPDEPEMDGNRFIAQNVYDALKADECPGIEGVIVSGLETPEHYLALQHAVRTDGVTVEQLADALGSTRKLQALIGSTNPYRSVVFRPNNWCDDRGPDNR